MSIWISFRQSSSEKIFNIFRAVKKLFILSFGQFIFNVFQNYILCLYIGLVDTFIENLVEVDRVVFTVLFFVKKIFK